MLFVKIGEQEFDISFRYSEESPESVRNLTDAVVDGPRRCSFANVFMDGESMTEGVAVCHKGDNFCKAIGRKRALRWAISDFPADVRRAIWTAYEIKFGFKNRKKRNASRTG